MAPEFKHLTVDEKKAIEDKFVTQNDFLAAFDFYSNPLNRQFRKLAVSAIATHCQGIDADAFVPYLAMNIFDRFFSNSKKPYSDIEEVRKVAMTCLFMASEDREIREAFFSERRPFDFNSEDIEEQIYDVIQFELTITPFYFLNYFYPPFEEIGGFRRRCINEIIVQAQGEDDFNTHNFTPAEIAFSSLLAAADILYPSIQIKVPVYAELAFCVKLLVELCAEKNIKIERASSSSATVAMPYHLGAAAETQTESGLQRKDKGKTIAEEIEEIEEDDDDVDIAELYPAEAPKRVMNFYLQWPTNVAD